ncbi:NAD(P)/FAD-dependent oxidoreductase [Ketobacter sp.]|uniref:NAD(P)/FAD-dependent oxidoreductase n=1 Tax=Ketobacter sp. TaxID=2083498 RepID=UPI000F17A6D0|nr:NAD(P)/FAD-dependent oxidoreductase [Ketobacter sp.]RLU00339.1 MAG: NAD(P)/FAD-dependent oxidoreductase [Ketobacter sp.]
MSGSTGGGKENGVSKSYSYDVIVIGGGAAGLFCAAQAAKRGRRVVVLERTAKVGKKILMSGGGRCNFTNMYTEPANYLSANHHFCKSALSRYTPWDFIGLVCEHGIPYHEKKLGQLFCDDSAKDILNMLLAECDRAGVEIHTYCEIQSLEAGEGFRVDSNRGLYQAEAVVIASGGLSIPTMGVTPFGYDVAKQFGLDVLPTRAGLVPFVFTDTMKQLCNTLSGVSVETLVSHDDTAFRENILFTHRGLSGPAILQISSYWQEGESVAINLLPDEQDAQWLLQAKQSDPKMLLKNLLGQRLPKKLVTELETLWWAQESRKPLAEFSNQRLLQLQQQLQQWAVKPAGTEGYRTAEVTLGGVNTDELSSKTMESKKQSGLYFIGEVVDVTGHLGGFNFQWAWASAYAAGEDV